MSLMTAVRNAISESHDSIEKTRFSVAMMDGSMTVDDYARGLFQLQKIHCALETSICNCIYADRVFVSEMLRTETIKRDLVSLGFAQGTIARLPETEMILSQIAEWSDAGSVSLLGVLYILEGSRMGSLVIAKPLSRTLGLNPLSVAGIEYHTEGATQTPARVRRMKEQLDLLPLNEAEQAEITYGAVRFMEMLTNLYSALPVCESPKPVTGNKCPFSRAIGHVFGRSKLKTA